MDKTSMGSSLPHDLRPLFEQIESRSGLREEDAGQAVWEFIEKNKPLPADIDAAAFAERFVFTLMTDPRGERGCWGIYFCPMFVSYKSEGGVTSHALESVTPQIIDYWTARASQAMHPVLRARYGDAAWELSKIVEGAKTEVSNCRTAIDAYVTVASAATEVYPTINYLRRALNLALSIHDEDRVERVVAEMFSLAGRGANPAQIGTSVAVFDSVYDLRKKIKLTPERERRLIEALEECLRHSAGQNESHKLDHFAAQRYAELLLKVYRSQDNHDEVVRVTRLMAGTIEKAAEVIEPSVAVAWLHDAQIAYARAGLKEDSDRVLVVMKQKGREAQGRMVSQVIKQEIPVDEVEAFLDHITSGGLDKTFARIVSIFLPQSKELRKRLAEIKDKYPMISLFPIALLSDDQVVARVGSADSDEEGRLVNEIAQDMQFWAIFLMQSLERMFTEYNLLPEEFLDLLYQRTPIWGLQRYPILKNGLRRYREGDFIAAIHVLVPQIEHALKVMLAVLQRPTNLFNPKLDAYQERDLGSILADESLKKLLGEDVGRYLRTLLTDQRGWNLRNRLSHGLYDSYFFQRQIADRIIHMLMVLACFQPSSTNAAGAEPTP